MVQSESGGGRDGDIPRASVRTSDCSYLSRRNCHGRTTRVTDPSPRPPPPLGHRSRAPFTDVRFRATSLAGPLVLSGRRLTSDRGGVTTPEEFLIGADLCAVSCERIVSGRPVLARFTNWQLRNVNIAVGYVTSDSFLSLHQKYAHQDDV